MFKMQPQEKKMSLLCTDIQKMTPLHCASMFDHNELVEFLVAEGADVNALGEFTMQTRISLLLGEFFNFLPTKVFKIQLCTFVFTVTLILKTKIISL